MANDNEIALRATLDAIEVLRSIKSLNDSINDLVKTAKQEISLRVTAETKDVDLVKDSLLSVGSSIVSVLNPLNILNTAFSAMSTASSLLMGGLSSLGGIVSSAVTAPFKLAYSIFETGMNVVSGFGSAISSLMFNLANLGQSIDTLLTLFSPLINAFTFVKDAMMNAINVTSEFENQMSKVGSVSSASAADLETMRQAAIKIGADTPLSASQAADALYALASAGMNAKDSVSALQGTALLATATQSDLGQAAEIVASSITQFKLSAEDAGRVSNTFTAAINVSQLNMERLAYSMKYVGPVAGALGISFEEVTGTLAALSNAGIMSEQAGTTLRSMMTDLITPSTKLNETLGALGLSMADVDPRTKGLAGAIDALKGAGMTTADAMKLFGEAAGPGMVTLLDAGGGAIRQMTASVTGTNAAMETATMQMDNYYQAQEQLKGAMESLNISIGSVFMGSLKNGTQILTEFVNYIMDWTTKSGLLTAATNILDTTFGLFKQTIAAISPLFSTLGMGIASFIASITSTISAIVDLVKNSTVLQEGFKAINIIVVETTTKMTQMFTAFNAGAPSVTGSFTGVKSAITGIKDAVMGSAAGADTLNTSMSTLGTSATSTVTTFIPFANALQNAQAAALQNGSTMLNLATSIKTVADNGVSFVPQMNAIGQGMQQVGESAMYATTGAQTYSFASLEMDTAMRTNTGTFAAWVASAVGQASIIDVLKLAMDGLKTVVLSLSDTFISITQSTIQFLGQVTSLGPSVTTLSRFMTTLGQSITSMSGYISQTVTSFGQFIAQFVSSGQAIEIFKASMIILKDIFSVIGTIAQGAGSLMMSAFASLPGVMSAIMPVIKQVADGIATIFGQIAKGDFKGAFQTFAEGIKTGIQGITQIIRDNADTIWGAFKAMWETLKEMWATVVVPILQELFDALMIFIKEQGPKLSVIGAEMLGSFVKTMADTLTTLLPSIFKGMADLGKGLQEGSSGAGMSGIAASIMKPLQEAFKSGLALVKLIVTDGFNSVIELIKGSLVSMLGSIQSSLPEIGAALGIGTQSISKSLGDIIAAIKAGDMGKALSETLSMAKQAIIDNKPAIEEAMHQLLDIFKNALGKEFFDSIGDALKTGLQLAIIGAVTYVLGTAALVAIGIALGTFFGGFALLIVAGAAIVGLEFSKSSSDWTEILTDTLKGMGSDILGPIDAIFRPIGQFFIDLGKSFGKWATTIWDTFWTFFGSALDKGIGGIVETLSGISKAIYDFFIGHSLIDDLPKWFGMCVDALVTFIKGIGTTISDTFLTLFAGIKTIVTSVVDTAKSIGKGFIDGVVSIVKTGASEVSGVFTTMWDFLSAIITTVIEYATQIGQGFIDGVTGIIKIGSETISTTLTTMWDFLVTIVTTVTDYATQIGNAIIDTITGLINSGAETIQSTFASIWNFLTNTIATVTDAGSQIGEGLMNAISSAIEAGVSLIQGAIDGVINVVQGAYDSVMSIVDSIKNAVTGASTAAANVPSPPSGQSGGGVDTNTGDGMSESERFNKKYKMATGGIVRGSLGGTSIIAGDENTPEAVVPLPNGKSIPVSMPNMPDFSALAIAGGGSSSINVSFGDIVINNDQDEKQFIRKVERAINDAMIRMNGRR